MSDSMQKLHKTHPKLGAAELNHKAELLTICHLLQAERLFHCAGVLDPLFDPHLLRLLFEVPKKQDPFASQDEELALIQWTLERQGLAPESLSPAATKELHETTRADLQMIGYAFWEVLRDHDGKPVQVVQVPAVSTRLMPLDREVISFDQVQQIGLTQRTRRMRRRFRRFVQVVLGFNMTYFKEFGDPRIISSRSNRVYASLEALEETEPGTPPATELVYFKIHSPLSPYGVPRWVGAWLCVKGSRAAEEQPDASDSATAPGTADAQCGGYYAMKSELETTFSMPGLLIVSGAKLKSGAKAEIENYIHRVLNGRVNLNKLLILGSNAGEDHPCWSDRQNVHIEWIPVTQVQHVTMLTDGVVARLRAEASQRCGEYKLSVNADVFASWIDRPTP